MKLGMEEIGMKSCRKTIGEEERGKRGKETGRGLGRMGVQFLYLRTRLTQENEEKNFLFFEKGTYRARELNYRMCSDDGSEMGNLNVYIQRNEID